MMIYTLLSIVLQTFLIKGISSCSVHLYNVKLSLVYDIWINGDKSIDFIFAHCIIIYTSMLSGSQVNLGFINKNVASQIKINCVHER